MALFVRHVDTPSRDEWRAMFLACDYATFFHGPDWAEIWRRFGGGAFQSVPERLTFSDGRQAILPLSFESKFPGLGRYVASPQGTFGGWIATDALSLDHASLLLDQLLDAREGSLVWRMNPYEPLAFEAGLLRDLTCKNDQTHALRLDAGAAQLLANFKNGYRNDVRKAIKRDRISVDLGTTRDEWRAYYRVYQETLERWGHTPQEGYPWELFETMLDLRSPNIKLWLGRYDGAIVSGELCFYAKSHVVSWHAATLRDFLRSDVAKVQIYRVIEAACAAGYHWFDFNPSAGLDGVRAFKESFGARPLSAPLVYVDSPVKRFVRGVASTLSMPYARLSLHPLAEVLQASRPGS